MKEIPKVQNNRRRTRKRAQEESAPPAQQENASKQMESVSAPQQPPKQKKIHHQTLKAIERRKKAEQQRIIKQQQQKERAQQQNAFQSKQKDLEKSNKRHKSTQNASTNKLQNKGRKGSNKPTKTSSVEIQAHEAKEAIYDNNNNQENMDQQKLSINSNQNNIQQANNLKLKKQKVKIQKNTKVVLPAQLTYYQTYYDNIFDVLRPLDDIQQDYLIFDKSKSQQYNSLVQKIKQHSHKASTADNGKIGDEN